MKARSGSTRAFTAETVREISKPMAPATDYRRELLPSLVEAYKAEKPGTARDALAETVRLMGGVEHWQQVTGRANGLTAYLQDVGAAGGQGLFLAVGAFACTGDGSADADPRAFQRLWLCRREENAGFTGATAGAREMENNLDLLLAAPGRGAGQERWSPAPGAWWWKARPARTR